MAEGPDNAGASPVQAVEAQEAHRRGRAKGGEQVDDKPTSNRAEGPSPTSYNNKATPIVRTDDSDIGNHRARNTAESRRRPRTSSHSFPSKGFRTYEHLYLPGGPLAPTYDFLSIYNQPQFVPGPTCNPAFAVHYTNSYLNNYHLDHNVFAPTQNENNIRRTTNNNSGNGTYIKSEPNDGCVTLYAHHPFNASAQSERVTVAPDQVTCHATMTSPKQNPNISEPKAHHHIEAHQDPITTITNRVAKPPPQGKHPINTHSMPSAITAMPEQQFSYPPLGEMLETHHPYALPEQRAFHQLANERDYAHDEHGNEHLANEPPRYATPPANSEYQLQNIVSELQAALDPKTDGSDEGVRSKPVPKPDRPVKKDDNGRYVCNWPGCDEVVKDFGRKCEWSKHMDKHDRPYKCPVPACAKLPGFTYSGGLLRHEREVHQKHGGPRKQLNCPHMNCKRHHGKGFSRQENLNEHLRRVHTGTGTGEPLQTEESEEGEGGKRKREGDEEVRDELKRIKNENEELKRQTEEMMRQIRALQEQAEVMAQQQIDAHVQQQAQQAVRMPAASMM